MSSRRGILQAIAGLSIASIVAGVGLDVALTKMFDDAKQFEGLIVPSGETYTIDSGETETYSYAEINGTLDANGTLEVR